MLGGMMQSIGVGGTIEASEMNISWLTFDNANERLGIGTAAPSSLLNVVSADTPTIKIQDTTNNKVLTLDVDDTNAKIQAGSGSGILFRTNGSNNRMFIDFSGDVGIGTTVPDYKLSVAGDFGFAPGTSVTPANDGDVVIEATNNTTLTFKLKGTDSIVRTGTITLS